MPLQREKTALRRGALDNLYLHNNPRVEVAESNASPNRLDDPTLDQGAAKAAPSSGYTLVPVDHQPDSVRSMHTTVRDAPLLMPVRSGR